MSEEMNFEQMDDNAVIEHVRGRYKGCSLAELASQDARLSKAIVGRRLTDRLLGDNILSLNGQGRTNITEILEDIVGISSPLPRDYNEKVYKPDGYGEKMGNVLPSEFFARESEQVAKDLLGKLLVRGIGGRKRLAGMISQVDAYAMPKGDVKVTKRNQGAFYPAGMIHMYSAQGNWCMAISTLGKDVYNEILIRKVLPLEGLEEMRANRGSSDDKTLTDGPGKISKAFGIDKDFDGQYVFTQSPSGLWIEEHLNQVRSERESRITNPSSDFIGRYNLI